MKNNDLYSLRQQLERSYLLEAEIPTSCTTSWWQRFQIVWRNFATFMIHQPEPQLQPSEVASDAYTHKISLYLYLPAVEAERDWLEKTYYKSARDHHTT